MSSTDDGSMLVVFQGGVAQLGNGGFLAELTTTKSVSLGVTGDLWDAIELFVAGLRHCQSMLREDSSVSMETVTSSLEASVARGTLRSAVEDALAVR